MQNKNTLAYVSVVASMICWSLSFVWIKIVLETYSPITTTFIRLILSATMLLIISKLIGKLQKIERKDYKWLFLLAFFEPFLYFLGETSGMKYISPTLGSVIIATIPLFCPFAELIFFKQKISPKLYLGILMSVIGVATIVFENGSPTGNSYKGIALLSLAVFATLGYSISLRKIAGKYNSITIVTIQNTIGILLFMPLVLFFDWNALITTIPSKEVIKSLIYLAVFASSLAFIFYTYSINYLGISKSSVFCNIIPVFTAFFAYFILDEKITLQKIIGVTIVILGLFLSQIKIGKRKVICQ